MVHRVKTHRWNMGVLETIEHFFEELEEALSFAETVPAHAVKVFNHDDEVVHSTSMLYTEKVSSYSGVEESYSGSTYA